MKNKTNIKNAFKFIFLGLRKSILIADCLIIMCWTLCNVYNDRLLARIATDFIENHSVVHNLIKYIMLVTFWAILEWIGDILTSVNEEDVELSTRKHYIERMYKCKPSILRNYNTGYISGIVDKLTYRRSDVCHMLLEEIPLSTTYLVAICGIMTFSYHWIYAVIIFGFSMLAVLFRLIVNKKNMGNINELRESEAENVQLFLDSGTNINTVQKLQAMPFIHKKFEIGKKRCQKAVLKWARINEIAFCGFKFITYLILPVCAVVQIKYPETIIDRTSFYTFLVMVQLRLLHMVRSYSRFFDHWARYSSQYEKLEHILSAENMRETLSLEEFEYAEIKDCDYSYEYKMEEHGELSKTVRIQIPYFRVDKGDIICIHGESGQGKTTLLNILSGEIETDTVYINGNQTTKRLDCVFIAQDTEIFDMTIMENLSLGNEDITEKDIYEMFEMTGLTSWIEKQPEKLKTRLGERGVFVSTGQRQRLNMIRGLIIPYGEIYLLDEPTSNVDSETEEKMITLIQRELKGKTAIIVTHKPSIMRICNKSYLFTNGILSEDNSKEMEK